MAVRVELRRDAGKLDPRACAWIRRRSVARVLGPPDPGAVAVLVDHRGRILGHGLYSPDSAIVLRLLCTGEQPPAEGWLERRLAAALAGREALGLSASGPTTGYREVNSEGDGLPGLVVDRFGRWRVVQITTAPMAARRQAILTWFEHHAPLTGGLISLLPEAAAAREGFEPGVEVRAREGGETSTPDQLEWVEDGRRLSAPAPPAQKTGAYHDQRDNRSRFAALACVGPGARVLDLGCHVGGFAIAAARAGAELVAVDQSTVALDYLRRNAIANGVSEQIRAVTADMFGKLDEPDLAGPFEAIVFDPPKIATGRRNLGRAIEAMSRTLTRLIPRLRPTGVIAVCSCSHHLGWEELDRAILDATPSSLASSLARVARWGAGLDHPIAPMHHEGEYLRVALYQRRSV
jgi:23S rRNA (cytosine1962-C5)-methyltransferase